jgi:hypothetical protein
MPLLLLLLLCLRLLLLLCLRQLYLRLLLVDLLLRWMPVQWRLRMLLLLHPAVSVEEPLLRAHDPQAAPCGSRGVQHTEKRQRLPLLLCL